MNDILCGNRIHLRVLLTQWTDDKDDVACFFLRVENIFGKDPLTMVRGLGVFYATQLCSCGIKAIIEICKQMILCSKHRHYVGFTHVNQIHESLL